METKPDEVKEEFFKIFFIVKQVKEKVKRVFLKFLSLFNRGRRRFVCSYLLTQVKEEVRPDGRTDASASSEATVTVIHLFKLNEEEKTQKETFL